MKSTITKNIFKFWFCNDAANNNKSGNKKINQEIIVKAKVDVFIILFLIVNEKGPKNKVIIFAKISHTIKFCLTYTRELFKDKANHKFTIQIKRKSMSKNIIIVLSKGLIFFHVCFINDFIFYPNS